MSSLLQSLHDAVLQHAQTTGFISADSAARLSAAREEAKRYSNEPNEQHFNTLCKTTGALLPEIDETTPHTEGSPAAVEEGLHISKLLALESIISNAFVTARNAAFATPSEDYIRTTLEGVSNEARREEKNFAEVASAALEKTVVSLVHTMHPTIFHSDKGREYEKRLTEAFAKYFNTPGGKQLLAIEDKGNRFSVKALPPAIQNEINAIIDELNKDKNISLTQNTKITVDDENEREKEHIAAIKNQVQAFGDNWNKAIRKLAGSDEKFSQLLLDDKKLAKLVELRTWGRSGDADGRENSTSLQLFEALDEGFNEKGEYTGDILDLRHNKKENGGALNAFLQRNEMDYALGIDPENEEERNCAAVHDICEKYFKASGARIFEELKEPQKTELVKELISKDTPIVYADAIRGAVKDTTEKYKEFKFKFLNRFKTQIEAKGFKVETINLEQMKKVAVRNNKGQKINLQKAFKAEAEKAGVKFGARGLEYQSSFSEEGMDSPYIQTENYLEDTYSLSGRNTDSTRILVPNDAYRRATLMDVFKRLIVVNAAIDKSKAAGSPPPVTRHQIANFSNVSDFYIMLKLMQDAGLVTVEKHTEIRNGKKVETAEVTNVKVNIQPLFETGEDLAKASDIYEKLLEDPLASSFFQCLQRKGKPIEVMVGFSDGAASVGHLASQWAIHQATQKLYTTLHEKGFALRVFQGRGRGLVRGGTFDSVEFMHSMMPKEITQSGICDFTPQSDFPQKLFFDGNNPQFITEAVCSTFKNAVEGILHPASAQKNKNTISIENAISLICAQSADIYTKTVAGKDAAATYVSQCPNNPNASSRSVVRSEGIVKWDTLRAVLKEHVAGTTGLPFHLVGINKALATFANQSEQELADQGIVGLGNGQSALKTLVNQSPFFKHMLESSYAEILRFDPELAKLYGRNTGTAESFVEPVCKELHGLKAQLEELIFPNFVHKNNMPKTSDSPIRRIDTVANLPGIIGSFMNALIKKADSGILKNIMHHAYFASAQGVGRPESAMADIALGVDKSTGLAM